MNTSSLALYPLAIAAALAAMGAARAQNLTEFVNGTTADATQVNANFRLIEGKADQAQQTADGATTTANQAQTLANQARSTADGLASSVNPLLSAINLANGNLGLGVAPTTARLDVGGDLRVAGGNNTTAGARLYFGANGQNSDPIYFERNDSGNNLSNLRLVLGDDPQGNGAEDRFIITTRRGSAPAVEQNIFDFGSDGWLRTPLTFEQRGFGVGDGITLKRTGGSVTWDIYYSGSFCSFAANGTRVAYVSDSSGAWVTQSDRRLKRDIRPLDDTLDRVMQLRPVSYLYNHQAPSDQRVEGFVAQEVEQLFPAVVSSSPEEEGSDVRGVAYGMMSVYAIKAIQEQQQLIERQQATIAALAERLERLERR